MLCVLVRLTAVLAMIDLTGEQKKRWAQAQVDRVGSMLEDRDLDALLG